MALQQSFDDSFGTTHSTAYFRVTNIKLDYRVRKAHVVVAVYKDAAARTADKEPLALWPYDWTEDDFDSVFGVTALSPVDENPTKAAYDEIKSLDEFSGASDV